jgi:hypothetical protein
MNFHIKVTTGGQKAKNLKMAEFRQAENSNLNMDVIYKCHITNSKQSGTIGYSCSQVSQVPLRRGRTHYAFKRGQNNYKE